MRRTEAGSPKSRPRLAWLQGAAEPFVVALHEAPEAVAGGMGVVVCPPFGWEEMSSYRPRRAWAQAFADAGIPAVRLDLPGQGDAGGDATSPDRLGAWTDAIGATAAWLRDRTGCRRVVAVGISLGGLLALRAAAEGAPIDDFILWGVPAGGKAFTRELRAFGRMEANTLQPEDRSLAEQALPEGALVAGGYMLSAETRSALDALTVAGLALPAADRRAALLLERDGMAPAEALVDGLRGQGVAVQVSPGRGFGHMLTEPQFARLPREVVARSIAFVRALETGVTPSACGRAWSVPVATAEAAVAGPGGEALLERLVEWEGPEGRIVGILTETTGGPGGRRPEGVAVLLGGTGHRIGPNRLWVEIARRWAAEGIPSLRVDVGGAGDSEAPTPPDTPALYTRRMVAETDWLLERVVGETHAPQAFAVGLCAGAYWALHASLDSRTPVVPFMVNLPTLMWDRSGHAERAVKHYRELLLERETWRRLRRGEISLTNAPKAVLQRVADRAAALTGRPGRRPLETVRTAAEVLDHLRDGSGAWMFFSGREALQEQLERDGMPVEGARWSGLHVDVVPGQSDLHTLRPLWLQRRMHDRIDAALAEQLARSRG